MNTEVFTLFYINNSELCVQVCVFMFREVHTGIPLAPAGPEGPEGPCAPCEIKTKESGDVTVQTEMNALNRQIPFTLILYVNIYMC